MSSTKRTTKNPGVSFGNPITDLPDANRGPGNNAPAAHWVKVAEHAKNNPGEWHPVVIDHLTISGHKSAVHQINAASKGSASRTGKNKAFLELGYQAAYRKGLGLLVRYDAPAKVRSIGKRAS